MFLYIKNDYAVKSCATTRAAALGQNKKKHVGYNIVSNVMNSVFFLISPAIFVSDSLSLYVFSVALEQPSTPRHVVMLSLNLILLVGFFFAQGQVVRQRVDDELLHVL